MTHPTKSLRDVAGTPNGTVRVLRVGTRASLLARTQTDLVADALGVPVEIVPIVTDGDRSAAAVTELGGTGVFVSALRTALLEERIDVAVHSYKDLPTAPADGIVIAAVPRREDPRDALVARDGLVLGELPAGSTVGTGSPRRAAQLRALGLGLEVVPVRGNVDTRLGRVGASDLDAVVLALAGLRRLGRDGEVTEILDPIQVLPAPAQGALAVECRSADEHTLAVLAELDDLDSRAAVTAERALLAALEAGCSAPVGALAVVAEGEPGSSAEGDDGTYEVFLRGSVTAIDGSDAVRLSATGPTTDAEGVGRRLAAELLADGADTMMGSST
jgi:hydroxymethylbilane synthase